MRTEPQIRDIFRTVFNGAMNFMTPDVIEYGTAGKYLYELSTDKASHGIFAGIHGVTVLNAQSKKRITGLDSSFSSLKEARSYIKELNA